MNEQRERLLEQEKTEEELQAEITALGITTREEAASSILKIPCAGVRTVLGQPDRVGVRVYMYTSTVSASAIRILFITIGVSFIDVNRANGCSVRLIKEQ